MKRIKSSLMFVALSSLAVSAHAAVSAEEAKQLGNSLTIFGAEKAGNKEGTIPEYTGALIKAPAGYDPVKEPGLRPDPWNEKPLYTITAQNADKYADKLDGWREVFKFYPEYRMNVYPTHRTVYYPKYVLDNSLKNATSCRGKDNELRLEGCYGGVPFPIPKTGNQLMWNHLLAFEGHQINAKESVWGVPATSAPFLSDASEVIQNFPYYDPAKTTTNGPKDIFWRVRTDSSAPARRAGQKVVLIDLVDTIGGRRAYSYIPGQRRVKLAPDLSYDTPSPWVGSYCTMDDGIVFLGPLDRFDWKLIGKKEKLIEYNNFKAYNDPKTCPDKVLLSTKHVPNPDCSRFELHRVWVVEGTLKPEFRHIYKKRILYFDEDGYGAGTGEMYDAGGKLFRLSMNYMTPMFDVAPGNQHSATYYLDLTSGGYAIGGMSGIPGGYGWWAANDKPKDDFFYSPEAMAGEGIR